jgi:hypothetical protein
MIDRMHPWLADPQRDALLALAFVGYFVCQILFAWRSERLGTSPSTPDVRWNGYSRDEIATLFQSWGDARRLLYARTQVTLDVLFPVCYALLFAILTARLYPAHGWRWLVVVPLVAALADLVENLVLAGVAFTNGNGTWGLIPVASWATRLKFLAFTATLVALLIGGAAGLRQRS